MVAPAAHARSEEVTSSSDSEASDAEQSARGAAAGDAPPASASHRPLPDTAWLSDDSDAPQDAPGAAPKDNVPEFYDPDLDVRCNTPEPCACTESCVAACLRALRLRAHTSADSLDSWLCWQL
jgi:hypothetical protein